MKKQKIEITQENGVIEIYRNGELEHRFLLGVVIERIKQDKISEIALANWMAEMLCDCLNCKSASATLKDLNDTEQYSGTYFEQIDFCAKHGI